MPSLFSWETRSYHTPIKKYLTEQKILNMISMYCMCLCVHSHTCTFTQVYTHPYTHILGLFFSPPLSLSLSVYTLLQECKLYKNVYVFYNTDDSLVKNKSTFFPGKDNNSELNTFFEKLWKINLKKKTYTEQPLTHIKTSLEEYTKKIWYNYKRSRRSAKSF